MTMIKKYIEDKDGNQVLPITHFSAVKNSSGDTLEDVLYTESTYDPTTYSGMGRKMLQKNMVNGVNTLTQDMMPVATGGNTIYIIRYDFTLGEDITLPENCVLEFDGGSISGSYTLTGANTSIKADLVKIFGIDIQLKKQSVAPGGDGVSEWNVDYFYAEWFGAKGDGITDDTAAIQAAINNAELFASGVCCVKLQFNHTYNISSPIRVPSFMRFGGLEPNEPAVSDYFVPTIQQTTNGNIIELCGRNFQENDGLTRTTISDLHLIGQSNSYGKGISLHSTCPSFASTLISGIFVENLKCGIYLDAYNGFATWFKNITCAHNNIGIGMYLKMSNGCWGLNIVDCSISYTTIGGIYFEAPGNSGPVNFLNTYIEGCGNEYNLADLNEWGCWGLYIKGIGNHIGLINLDNCYFECNSPTREWKENDLHNDNPYGFIEAENPSDSANRYIYITNPNFKKTAEIVIESKGTHVNVSHTHFSVDYQTVSIVNGGMLSFIDNDIYVTGKNLPNALQDSIIKVYDEKGWRNCGNIGVRLEKINTSGGEDSIYNIDGGITNSVDIVNSIPDDPSEVSPGITSINPNSITLTINNLLTNEVFNYNQIKAGVYDYGHHAVIYLSQSSLSTGIGALTCPCTINRAVSLLNLGGSYKEVTFILLDDITPTAVCLFKPGIKYNFVSLGATKTISNAYRLDFSNSDVLFENVNIDLVQPYGSFINACNSSITYIDCTVDYKVGNNKGVCTSFGFVTLSLKGCTLMTSSQIEVASVGNNKQSGLVFTDVSSDCVNSVNVQFVDDSTRDFNSIPVV